MAARGWVVVVAALIALSSASALALTGTKPGLLTPVKQSPASHADTGTWPRAVTFSPSGALLAAADYDGDGVSMFKVDKSTGALSPIGKTSPSSIEYPSYAPNAVAFSPSGKLLATTDYEDSSVAVFSVAANGHLTPVTQSTPANALTGGSDADSVAFSPSGRLLAVSNGSSSTVSMFTITSSGQLKPVTQSPASNGDADYGPDSVSFSQIGDLLATANDINNSVSVFKVTNSGDLTPVTQSPVSNASTGVGSDPLWGEFSPGGGLFVVANQETPVSVFRVNSSGDVTPVVQHPSSNADAGEYPYAIAFSPNGKLIATANAGSNNVSVFEIASSGALTRVKQSPASKADTGNSPESIAFSPHGELIATANFLSSTVSVFKVTGGAAVGVAKLGSVSVKKTTVTVKVSCHGAAAATCSGSLALVGVKPKTKRLGTAHYSVSGGATKAIKITLYGGGKTLLKHHHRPKVKVTLTPSGAKSPSASKTFTL